MITTWPRNCRFNSSWGIIRSASLACAVSGLGHEWVTGGEIFKERVEHVDSRRIGNHGHLTIKMA